MLSLQDNALSHTIFHLSPQRCPRGHATIPDCFYLRTSTSMQGMTSVVPLVFLVVFPAPSEHGQAPGVF